MHTICDIIYHPLTQLLTDIRDACHRDKASQILALLIKKNKMLFSSANLSYGISGWKLPFPSLIFKRHHKLLMTVQRDDNYVVKRV